MIFFKLLPPFPKSAGSAKEFRDWDIELQTKYPVRYKINDVLYSTYRLFVEYPVHIVFEIKWWLLHRFHPKHTYNKITVTSLEPGYYDCRDLLLHASFDLFTKFMEHAMSDDCYTLWDYDSDKADVDPSQVPDIEQRKERWNTMKQLYNWWTTERPNRTEPDLPVLPTEWGLMSPFNEDFDNEPVMKLWREAAAESNSLSEQWELEDQQRLHQLIDLRLHLWD